MMKKEVPQMMAAAKSMGLASSFIVFGDMDINSQLQDQGPLWYHRRDGPPKRVKNGDIIAKNPAGRK